MTSTRPLTFTLYGAVHEKLGVPETHNWEEWKPILLKRDVRDEKDGRAFVAGTIPAGKVRGKRNVTAIDAITIDIEKHEDAKILALIEKLSPWPFVIWTTHQHGTEPTGRYRIVVPLSRAITPAEHPIAWRGFNEFCGSLNDPNTKDIARLNFLPSCPADREQEAWAEQYETKSGEFFDPGPLLLDPPTTSKKNREATPIDTDAAEAAKRRVLSEREIEFLTGRWTLGQRHALHLALAGAMRKGGWTETEAASALKCIQVAAGDTEDRAATVASTYGMEEASRLLGWSGLAELGITPDDLPSVRGVFQCTDLGNAERFAQRHGHEVRYAHAWGKWLAWDGQRWEVDAAAAVERFAKRTVRSILRELSAASANSEDKKKGLFAHALRSESSRAIAALLALARSEIGIAIKSDALDSDGMLLNVANGTIDLRTGALRPHSPLDLITKLSAVSYDLKATCPVWTEFLARVLPDTAVRAFVQRTVGYALTGSVAEQCLFFLYGTGANGKSTFLTVMQKLLGDYGGQAAPDLLMSKFGESHPTELAALLGKRFVVVSEVEAGRAWAEVRIKELTGGDTIAARRMREDWWSFRPTHKFVVSGNHRPTVRGTDLGIWRRLRLVPFNVTIPESERDGALVEKLEGEQSGILNWAIEGCRAWQRDGLRAPAAVTAATEAYRSEQDVLAEFLELLTVAGRTESVTAAELYAAYSGWARASGEFVLSQKALGTALTERGFEKRKSGSTRQWRGIGLRTREVRGPFAERKP